MNFSHPDSSVENNVPGQPAVKPMNVWVGAVIVLAVAGAIVVAWKIDWWGRRGSGLPQQFEYDLKPPKIDPGLVKFRQAAEITLAFQQAKAIAVGPEDKIYVAGEKTVHVFDPSGTKQQEIALDASPTCLAVGGDQHEFPGRIYVGLAGRVAIFDRDGKSLVTWIVPGKEAMLTSIALAEKEIFVADAKARVVVRYDSAGKVLGLIGKRDKERKIPGLIIPSPYFDVAVAPDGLLRVANPGGHRIEAYTFAGDLETHWGCAAMETNETVAALENEPGKSEKKALAGLKGFCGCCNPANFALFPDGKVVTAEKGIPWVKIFTEHGDLLGMVADPNLFMPNPSTIKETRTDHKLPVLDVAVDSHGRVLVLDPGANRVRIFVLKL